MTEETTATEETVTELETASPVPGRPDETIGDEVPDETETPAAGERSGGSLLWVLLLGAGLIVAAVVLFFIGRRGEA